MENKASVGYFHQQRPEIKGDLRPIYAAITFLIIFGTYVACRRYQELNKEQKIVDCCVKGGVDLNELIYDPEYKDNEFVAYLLRVILGKLKISSFPFQSFANDNFREDEFSIVLQNLK